MNRGSPPWSISSTPAPRCFNEAPIHESGKCRVDDGLGDLDLASMRPRFMNRGSAPRPDGSPKPRPCFNEAPIHESGKFPGRWQPRRKSAPLQ